MDERALLAAVRASPRDEGSVVLIVLRPASGERLTPPRAVLSAAGGAEGDRWGLRQDRDPSAQVSVINARLLAALAGSAERMGVSGDNLALDLDLSEGNLPAGSRLRVGEALLEVTGRPHQGCRKFEGWFGKAARDLVDSPPGRALRLRGLYARVLEGGAVRVGDPVRRAAAAEPPGSANC